MPVPVARPVNLLHDFAIHLYYYLGATTRITRIVAGLSVWRGMLRAARHASGCVFSPPLHDFRKIPTYIARMSQKGRDACTIVVLVQAL